MWSRVLVGVGLLCILGCRYTHALAVVDASIKDNGLDEPTTSDGCNSIQCDQNCRRIGFNGGACVGNKCKCDVLQTEKMGSIPTNSVTSCEWSSCNSYCQTVGFISGYCLYDNCICVYPKPTKKRKHAQDKTHGLENPTVSDVPQKVVVWSTDCDSNACASYYENIGYCAANYSQDKNNDNMETSIHTNSVTSCDWATCNSCCRSIGFITGLCLYDTCMCKYPKPTKKRLHTERKIHDFNTVRASVTLGPCNQRICSSLCDHIGYDLHQCYGNTCVCTHSQTGSGKIEESETSCNGQQCDQLCRRLGFTGGACVGDKCKCDILMEIEAKIEPTLRSSKGSCVPQQCDQNCRKIGFNGGACVGGRCKCDILKETDSVSESSDHHLQRREASDCEHHKCDNLCRRVNYDSGVCVADRCKCGVLLPIEDAIIPTDLGGGCTARCGNFCKSISMSGGSCVGTKCNCEILLQKEGE